MVNLAVFNQEVDEENLVDENIDEDILRYLGLEDVSDFEYDEYKTLLKERMLAGRMPGNEIPSDETEKVTEEYKRVRQKTGRFRQKPKVSSSSFFSTINKSRKEGTAAPKPRQKLLPEAKTTETTKKTKEIKDSIEDVSKKREEESAKDADIMSFLTNVVAPSLSRIENSLGNILMNMMGQQEKVEKVAEDSRVESEKRKKREKENSRELNVVDGIKNVAQKVISPFSDIFGAIFKFLGNVLAGFLALQLFEFLKDPKEFFRKIINSIIGFANDIIGFLFNFFLSPINGLIGSLNIGLENMTNSLNSITSLIPGMEPFEAPLIKEVEAPQIPKIPPPEEETSLPKENTTKVPTMEGGGQVTNNFFNNTTNMIGGGKVYSDTGNKVSGAGMDTQLVALQPGEIVMSKKAVDAYGADTLLGMNADAGGTNKPKTAKVMSVSGGGLVSAMQGGGMVGDMPDMSAMTQYISGDKTFDYSKYGGGNRSFYDKSGHGTPTTYHEHFAFKDRKTAEAAYNYFKKRGIQVTEFKGYDKVGGHSNNSAHYAGLAFDVPGSQWGGSGPIGTKDYAGSAKARAVLEDFFRERQGGKPKGDNKTSQQSSKPQPSSKPQVSKPKRSDFPKGRSGAARYQKALKAYNEGGGTTQVQPTQTVTGQQPPQSQQQSQVQASSPEGYESKLMPSSSAKSMYKNLGINENVWRTYKDTIASIETQGYSLGDSYGAQGGSGGRYDGRYQMGELAKKDAARLLGIPLPSRSEYRSNPQLQEDMFVAYTAANYGYLMNGSKEFRNATPIQRMQYLGYAHNQGWSKAAGWLETGVVSSVDGFGTKGTKFTDKLAKTLKPYQGSDISQQSTQKPKVQRETQSEQLSEEKLYHQPGVGYFDSSTQGFLSASQEEARSMVDAPPMIPTTDTTKVSPSLIESGAPKVSVKLDKPPEIKPLFDTSSSVTRQKPVKTVPPPPTSSDAGATTVVPIPPSASGGGGGGSSSSSESSQADAELFSPFDQNNPDLLVIRSIYNIIG